jgi:uroporphyrinogen-III decarboxylase
MKERIDIVVPLELIEQNEEKAERVRKTYRFEPTDRAPVLVGIEQWAMLAARGSTPGRYLRSPRDNLREQILNQKWRIENVRDDSGIPTRAIGISPDLGCLRGVEFPMEIRFQENQPPKAIHPLTEPEQIDTLEAPPPDGGVNGKLLDWCRRMRDMAGDFDVRLNGQPLEVTVSIGHGGGPIPSAFALAGSNLLLWTLLEPERTHRLMRIVTESHINCTRHTDELMGRDPNHAVGMGADAAEMLSPDGFREFVVPYYLQIWEQAPGPRALHMCGKIDHLLDILRDELKITHLNGFGFPADRHLLAEKLGGRVVMRGGPSPILLRDGPPEAILAECVDYLHTVGHNGGYILGEGGGGAPGTPVAHYALMVRAAEEAAGQAFGTRKGGSSHG